MIRSALASRPFCVVAVAFLFALFVWSGVIKTLWPFIVMPLPPMLMISFISTLNKSSCSSALELSPVDPNFYHFCCSSSALELSPVDPNFYGFCCSSSALELSPVDPIFYHFCCRPLTCKIATCTVTKETERWTHSVIPTTPPLPLA
jgi:hypothetical protein